LFGLWFYKDAAPTALRQVADDEAASSAPERFTFRQAANVAQAFGHDAAGGGRNINANPSAFQILRLA